jgi:heterodisulfide reductase subunit B2
VRYGFFPGCAYGSAAGYRESVDAVNRAIGVELVEILDWNCCGATAAVSLNADHAVNLCGRLFALAEAQGFDEIVTVCNACYASLQKAAHKIADNPRVLSEINQRLEKENIRISRVLPVRHYMDVLIEDIPLENWLPQQEQAIFKLPVAAYYGCQLTRPYGHRAQAERPGRLERLLRQLGLTVVEHSAKTLCCGASHMIPYASACSPLISRIIKEIEAKGGAVITTICPMCQFNLDNGQDRLKAPKLPVTYFTQIIGLAIGIDPGNLGLDKLLTPFRLGDGVWS